MGKEIIISWCKTKTCIYNGNGQCKKISIYIDRGKCGCFKSNKYYNSNGSLKK